MSAPFNFFNSLKLLISEALLWLLKMFNHTMTLSGSIWLSHNRTTMMNNVWAISDMHQVARTELEATVNWCQYKDQLREEKTVTYAFEKRAAHVMNISLACPLSDANFPSQAHRDLYLTTFVMQRLSVEFVRPCGPSYQQRTDRTC